MVLIALMFLFALSLSGAAAYYSIIGLMAIFAASPIPIAVMGSILEGSKLVIASWMYRNWSNIPALMKSYFTVSLVILMFLTSMGIFGYLSKAHLDQGVPTGDIAARIDFIDEQIKTEKENINAARQALAQLDDQINKYTELGSVSKGVSVRRQQQNERDQLIGQISAGQTRIGELNQQKAPQAAELRKVEAEVGPIKYIAALIYGDEATQDSTFLEKAVRIVIILIVVVFDPLAVVMLIAANWSIVHRSGVSTPPKPVEDRIPATEMSDPPTSPVEETKGSGPMPIPPTPEIISSAAEHPVFNPESAYWSKDNHHKVQNPVTTNNS